MCICTMKSAGLSALAPVSGNCTSCLMQRPGPIILSESMIKYFAGRSVALILPGVRVHSVILATISILVLPDEKYLKYFSITNAF